MQWCQPKQHTKHLFLSSFRAWADSTEMCCVSSSNQGLKVEKTLRCNVPVKDYVLQPQKYLNYLIFIYTVVLNSQANRKAALLPPSGKLTYSFIL